MKKLALVLFVATACVITLSVYDAPDERIPIPAMDFNVKSAPREVPIPVTRGFAVPVLMYHRICDLSESEKRSELARDLSVSPLVFDEQLRHLKDNGFSFLLASEVESAVQEGRELPERAICITMDDGYKDNFEQAFPILRKYGIPATIFLVTKTVETARHLTWDEVNIMHRENVGFGSHTVNHYELPGLSIDQIDYELRESRRVIESKLVEQISAVAYPSGRYNDTVVQRARLAGYKAGWKKGGGPVQSGADMFLLPRVRVNGGTTLKDFRRKVYSGAYILADRRNAAESMRNRSKRRLRLSRR